MGMYDHVKCKLTLPLPNGDELDELVGYDWVKNTIFQTKDFDSCLENYEIRENRELWREEVEREWEGDDYSRFGGHCRIVKSEWKFYDYTGVIFICEFIQSNDFLNDYWIEFKVKIIDGLVKSIELHKFEKKNNSERKLQEKEFLLKMKEAENRHFLIKKYELFVRYIKGRLYRFFSKLGCLFNTIAVKYFLR